MPKMGIVEEKYKADNRVIGITRMTTYTANEDIPVPEDKLVIVAIDNTEATAHIAKFTGAAGEEIVGLIRESAKQDENIVVIKRGEINRKSIDFTGITALKDYEVFELLEKQNLLMEKLND